MSKLMTLDVLSSIKGAAASKAIKKLFEVIKNAKVNSNSDIITSAVSLDDLREDVVISSTTEEKAIIIENFPKEKNGYLVVSKIIEE